MRVRLLVDERPSQRTNFFSFLLFFSPPSLHKRSANRQLREGGGGGLGCSKSPTSPSGKFACAETKPERKEERNIEGARMSGCEKRYSPMTLTRWWGKHNSRPKHGKTARISAGLDGRRRKDPTRLSVFLRGSLLALLSSQRPARVTTSQFLSCALVLSHLPPRTQVRNAATRRRRRGKKRNNDTAFRHLRTITATQRQIARQDRLFNRAARLVHERSQRTANTWAENSSV